MTCRAQHLGCYLEGQGHSYTLQQKRVRPITLLFEVRFRNYFTEMITILRKRVAGNISVTTLKVKVTAWPCRKIVSAYNFVIWCRISKLFHRNDHHIETTCRAQHLGRYLEMITILRQCVARKFGSLPWRSRSQHDLAAKSCPAYNFVIWSPISKLFHRNDHHIETTCHTQHLGRYLEGQGHSMT